MKLFGVLDMTARVKGNPVDWPGLNSTIHVATPTLHAMGYEITNITVDTVQKDGLLQPLEIKGSLYGGDFGVIGQVDLVKPNFPFESTFKLDRTSLELLKRDTPLKDQQLSGFVSLSGELKGNATDVKSFAGKTITQITDGYLWDLEIFSKILRLLSSSFQGGDVIITDASGTFTVEDGKVETNNFTLKSSTVSLISEGWLDLLDQSIDFNITPRLEVAPSSGGNADILSIINPTQGLINVHVSGTLTQPKIEHNISAPVLIKKTLQNTIGGLLKIFE